MDPGIDATAPVEPAGPCAAAASTKPNAKKRPNAKRNHMLSSEGSRHCWKTVSLTCGGAYAKSAELSRCALPHCGGLARHRARAAIQAVPYYQTMLVAAQYPFAS
jgi:hypothetical protein